MPTRQKARTVRRTLAVDPDMIHDRRVTLPALRLYAWLAVKAAATNSGTEEVPLVATIGEACAELRLTDITTRRAVAILRDGGWIKVVDRFDPEDGARLANGYVTHV